MSFEIDRVSLLVGVPGAATLASIERAIAPDGFTLGVPALDETVADWLARGAPGAPSSFADPADHLVAGLTGNLSSGTRIEIRPAPRRAVGPDLAALFVGAGEKFGVVEHVWLRVHRQGAPRVTMSVPAECESDPPLSDDEAELVAAIAREI